MIYRRKINGTAYLIPALVSFRFRGGPARGDVRVGRVAAGVVGADAIANGGGFLDAGVFETGSAGGEIGDFVEWRAVERGFDLYAALGGFGGVFPIQTHHAVVKHCRSERCGRGGRSGRLPLDGDMVEDALGGIGRFASGRSRA